MNTAARSPLFVAALLLVIGGCARTTAAPPSGTLARTLIVATVKVQKIDQQTRKVTLEMPDGSGRTVKVSEDVRNLQQVKAGDLVNVGFYESIVYTVRPAGTAMPGLVVSQQVGRAAPGERPSAGGAQVTTLTATVSAVDRTAGTVTLTGPDGDETTLKPQDATVLDRVAAGQLVEITLTEAVAISVEAPPAR